MTAGPIRIPLPTPFPVGPVNVWLLDGDPLTLVDAGPDTPETRVALERALARNDRRVEDIELLVLTHQHSDHIGLAGEIASRSGCVVAAQPALAEYVRDTQAALAAEESWESELLGLHGTPLDRHDAFLDVVRSRHLYGGPGVVVERLLAEGDTIDAGGRTLRVALRPGHSPTDTILVDEAGQALVGDHLIAHISSNPLVHRPPRGGVDVRERSSSVVTYLASLEQTAADALGLLHTGHGMPIADHRTLIAQRIQLHHDRAEQVAEALAGEPRTASTLSEELWPGIAVNQTYLTLCEVLGALDLLEVAGRVDRHEQAGTIVYALS